MMYWRWIYAYMAGHRTSTSLWLSDSYTCEFRFVCQWWLLFSSFQCGYVASDLFFPFPKSNSASQYANDDWQRPTSIVDLTAREPCRIFTFAKHVSFEHSTGIPCPVISSRRDGNINKRTKTQKFLDTRSSISQSATTYRLCSGAPRPVGDLAGAATFRSNRKYRYRSYTQPDVGNRRLAELLSGCVQRGKPALSSALPGRPRACQRLGKAIACIQISTARSWWLWTTAEALLFFRFSHQTHRWKELVSN